MNQKQAIRSLTEIAESAKEAKDGIRKNDNDQFTSACADLLIHFTRLRISLGFNPATGAIQLDESFWKSFKNEIENS